MVALKLRLSKALYQLSLNHGRVETAVTIYLHQRPKLSDIKPKS